MTRKEFMVAMKANLRSAITEGRQPDCPFCHKSLEIGQIGTISFSWNWDEVFKQYVFTEDDPEYLPPKCMNCGKSGWDFIAPQLIGSSFNPDGDPELYDLLKQIGLDFEA